MKSLLLKEHIFLKRSYFYITLVAMFFIPMLTAFNRDLDYFGIVFPVALVNITAFETINQDERAGWDDFQNILPIKKRDVVAEKFLLSIIMFAAMLISFSGANVIRYFMSVYQGYEFTAAEFITPVIANAIVMFGNGIGFLMYYGFGMKKQLNAFGFVTAFVVGAVLYLCYEIDIPVDGFVFGLCGVVLLAMLAFLGICYILTVKRYEKRS